MCLFTCVYGKMPSAFFLRICTIPGTLLTLGKLNFHSEGTTFASIYSRKITQNSQFQGRKIQISLSGDFFITYDGNLAAINHIKYS